MPKFKVGNHIAIPCEVKPGPFSEERLISFDSLDGPISGFVLDDELKKRRGDDRWLVRGRVVSVSPDLIKVWIEGSFFTTNGLATISREMAMAA